MSKHSDSLPPEILARIRKELRLNHEVAALRALMDEKQEKIQAIQATISMKEKIGIARASFYQKHDEIKYLESSINKDKIVVNTKVQEWKSHRLDIQKMLDHFLRAEDSQYRMSQRVNEDYHTLNEDLIALESKIKEFTITLGHARNSMNANYNTSLQKYEENAIHQIKETTESGYRLDGVIIKINNRVDNYNHQIAGSFLEHIKLPMINLINIGDIVNTFQYSFIEQSNVRADTILGKCEHLMTRQIPAFKKIVVKAATFHTQACHRYVEDSWERYRQIIWQEMHQPQSAFRHKDHKIKGAQPGAPVEDNPKSTVPFSIDQEKATLDTPPASEQTTTSSSKKIKPPSANPKERSKPRLSLPKKSKNNDQQTTNNTQKPKLRLRKDPPGDRN